MSRNDDGEERTTPAPTVTEGYLASGTFLGNYRILKKIGEGGMGVVYAAEHSMHGRVAIKVLSEELSQNEEFRKRFLREVGTMQRVSHKNIVRYVASDIISAGSASGNLYLVTEYLKGMNLEEIMGHTGPMRWGYVRDISMQLCSALSAIHSGGIVHRDLKPGNIMLLEDETAESGYLVKLLDFGIAKVADEMKREGSMQLTLAGMVVGTPAYLSPEQAQGDKIDHRSDIYSLGIIMYELLTGRVPFEADTPAKVAIMHAREPPPKLHEKYSKLSLPKGIEEIVMRTLRKKPAERFQSTEELAGAIHASEQALGINSLPAVSPAVRGGSHQRRASLGNYKILKKIGEGGMGVVYAAEHPIHGMVALKVISEKLAGDEESIRRFIREMKLMQKISHPNIVGYIGADVDSASGQIYLVTEFVDGVELEKIIQKTGPIPYEDVIGVSSQICDALSVIHGAGIVHRDLKPGNIMLSKKEKTAEGRNLTKVLDFGIARPSKDAKQRQSMSFTRVGGVIGTPEYLSPEQAQGEKVDHRSDIYSLGIIMYEMLTGKVPFEANTPEKVAIMHAREPPPMLREKYPNVSIPDNLEKVIMFSLEKDPNKRFQSAKDMRDVMQACALAAKMPPENIPRRQAVRYPPPPPPRKAPVPAQRDASPRPKEFPKPPQPARSVEVDSKYRRVVKAAGAGKLEGKLGETEYIGRDDPRHQRIVGGGADAGGKPSQRPVLSRMPQPAVAEPFTRESPPYTEKVSPRRIRYLLGLVLGGIIGVSAIAKHCRDYFIYPSANSAVPAVIEKREERTKAGREEPPVQASVEPLEQKLAACDFVSSPPGAVITYKGNVMGRKTPLKVQGLPYNETLEVKVELEGYETETKALPAPSSFSLNSVPCQYYFDLKKIAEMVQCTFTTEPNGVEIYRAIDGNEELIGKGTLHKEFPKGKEIAFVAKAEGYKNHPHTRIIEDPCQLKFTMRKERERERLESLYRKNESEQQARTSDNQEPEEVECLFVTHPSGADIYRSIVGGFKHIGRSPMRMNFKRSQREIFSARFEGYNSDSRVEIIEYPCKIEFDLSDMVECLFVTDPSGADIYRYDSVDLKMKHMGQSPMRMNFNRRNRGRFFARLEGYTEQSRVETIEHPCKIEFDMEEVRLENKSSTPSHLVDPESVVDPFRVLRPAR